MMSPRSASPAAAFEIRQQSWKLMADVADYHPACAKVLEGLFEGLAAGCGRRIAVHLKPARGRRAAVRLVDRLSAASACDTAAAAFAQAAHAPGSAWHRR